MTRSKTISAMGVKSSMAMMKMDFGSVVIFATHGIVVNVKA